MRSAAMLLVFIITGLTDALQAAPGRLERILAAKELRVCIWPDYYGISYRNPRTRQLNGIDVEMAEQLAHDLNVRLRFVDSSFAKLIEDMTSDRCDVAMFAIGITAERSRYLRFTSPHLISDVYGITTRSNRRIKQWSDIDQEGVIVVVARGTYHEGVMKERLKKARLLVKDTPHAREQEVESGRADVFMTDYPYSRRMLDAVDWARVIAPPKPFHLTPYAYAVVKGDDRWHARLEEFVKTVKKDGRLLAAAKRHRLDGILAP